MVLRVALAVGAGLLGCWLALLCVLFAVRPDRRALAEAVRLLPDLIRLATRLAADPAQRRTVRWRLLLLAGYLALPWDLVPDFVPVVGYADDALVVIWALRSVARHTGVDALRRHWPGTEVGLAAVLKLCRLPADPVVRAT